MRRTQLAAIAFTAVQAFAAEPKVISMTPLSSPTRGGVEVTFVVDNMPNPCGIRISPSSIVVFGETQVAASYDGNVLKTVAPPHSAGVVDVVVAPCLVPAAPPRTTVRRSCGSLPLETRLRCSSSLCR